MSRIIETLREYFSYEFVRYAFLVGILIALCASLFGVVLVLKRFSFIGDGLSHVAFGAMAVAGVMNLTDNMLLVLPVTVLVAVLLLRTGQGSKQRGDAAIAVVSVGALALGYLVMSVFSSSSNVAGDVCGTLFGAFSILTLSDTEVALCIALSVVVLLFFFLFYHKIFAVTFDEAFARATGVNASLYNLLVAVLCAVIIVLAMNLVGSLLISALIVFPALSAMRLCRSFRGVTLLSALLAVFSAALGILLSILIEHIPVGPTVAVVNLCVFLLCSLVGIWVKKS